MSALPKHDALSEYFALLRESDTTKYEFINGEIIAMSGASENHILINGNVVTVLNIALRQTACRVYGSDMQVAVASTYTYPDVSVMCGTPEFVEEAPVAMLKNPTALFEVLSPSTEQKDRTTKFDAYQQIATLQDYVLISQDQARVECFSRGEEGTWLFTKAVGLDESLLLPSLGVTLALSEVYERVTFEQDNEEA